MSVAREPQSIVGREQPAIALEALQRRIVARLSLGGAGIVHASHVVAAVGAVLDHVVDALIGQGRFTFADVVSYSAGGNVFR